MLKLKPNCECCDKNLPPDSREAMICTFECTFCATCADTVFSGMCPNCCGNFVPRPIRPAVMLRKYPASTERHLREQPCQAKAG
ncbi:DUF1272 domain-containing protein [Bradyrhizobium sp. G127]|jgi:hypothetical protein|uniref:DUF1272 domain-containing protein n=1 Tax=Bradyrhizobium sp. G127 TaxID=2904800 RepID=UPI001F2D0A2C|nr:DUF1272 domain-containing protein [Bradyrhizobium sp. G127]MCF2523606.1 DUF1272 domain-containing protein [Bradyrhizobium sp. G127]